MGRWLTTEWGNGVDGDNGMVVDNGVGDNGVGDSGAVVTMGRWLTKQW